MMRSDSPVRQIALAVAGPLAALLAILAVMAAVVPTSPVQFFDVDPRASRGDGPMGQEPLLTALGPAGIAWWQVALVAVSFVAIGVAITAGARCRKWSAILIALGIVFAGYHMFGPASLWEDWTQGGAWISAAFVGLAALHLGQIASARRWIVAVLVALAIPLAAEAEWYLLIDHPDSVRFFEENREALYQSRGWEAGSQQAVLYERRMRFADATGTFGLSNVLASVSAALAMLCVGLLAGAWLKRSSKRLPILGIAIIAALLGAVLVVRLTHSKGAVVAAAMVLGLLMCGLLAWRWGGWRKWLPWLTVACVAAAFAAVLLRGAMGPPAMPSDGFVPGREPVGERSLLFRSQYWSAAAKTAMEHPILGSGTTGFAQGYLVHKDPLNPETVTSSHNVFIDFITMLGVGGWAWSAALIAWLWLAARGVVRTWNTPLPLATHAVDPPVAGNTSDNDARLAGWVALLTTTGLFSVNFIVRQPTLYLENALLWLVAAVGFGIIAAMLGWRNRLPESAVAVGLWLSATVVLTHNQIEMAFFRADAMPVLWLILGTAGAGAMMPAHARDTQTTRKLAGQVVPCVSAALFSVALLVGMVMYGARTQAHETALAGAASALRRGDVNLALQRLEVAQHAAALDTTALRWRVQLHAAEAMPYIVSLNRQRDAEARAADALGWIAQLESRGDLPVGMERIRASLLRQAFDLMPGKDRLAMAEEAAGRVVTLSPYNVRDWLEWADLAAERGDRAAAVSRYETVMRLREQGYLDAADPLSESELRRIKVYLANQP